jgi:hypothetical protein
MNDRESGSDVLTMRSVVITITAAIRRVRGLVQRARAVAGTCVIGAEIVRILAKRSVVARVAYAVERGAFVRVDDGRACCVVQAGKVGAGINVARTS